MTKKFALVSLGCSKNLVDSEQMLSQLLSAGYEMVSDPDEADIAIVNTCAFIEDAKKEAIENILEIAQSKNTGSLLSVVVTGCMAQRYSDEIIREIPEVDAIVGCGSYPQIATICDRLLADASDKAPAKIVELGDINAPVAELARVQTTPGYTAYLKIAEGCDNHCAYCIIPALRGHYRSRSFDAIVAEAEQLAAAGVRELILVAQDTSRYGIDLTGQHMLPALLTRLCRIDGLTWIRLHYLYPDEVTEDLIEVVASEPKILKYLDMPIQHVSDRLLRSMHRRYTRRELEDLLSTLRSRIPGLILRTTVIVGLPGETEEEFEELCRFVRAQKFDRLGAFAYSREEGTEAYGMENQLEDDEKQRRAEILMDVQAGVVAELNAGRIGSTMDVLCEGYDRTAGCFFGRSYGESPDIDGKVFFTAAGQKPVPGDMVKVRITEDIDGDLLGELSA